MIGYDSIDEVINYINDNPKPLALYVFSNNKQFRQDIITRTSSGAVTTNDVIMHFTNPELPFGGVGSSGLGSYHGRFGFDAFSHRKPVLDKATWGDAPARYPPYTDANAKLFKFVSSIHSVDSGTFSNVFKYVALPVAAAAVAHYFGVRIHITLQQ